MYHLIIKPLKHSIHLYGQDAALRQARKNGIPFRAAYAAVFDRFPKGE